jgi:hypothetical protein
MKSILAIAGVLVLLRSGPAQGTKVPDSDVKKLGEAFATMVSPADGKDEIKKRDLARKEFFQEFERIDKSLKPASLLALREVWAEVFYAKRDLVKAPSGLGRVEEKVIKSIHAGKPAEFRYGLILPNGFDPKKRYPLLIALHDKGASRDRDATGSRYLEDVWMKLPKEERDQYIIMAPTMGPGAAGKEHRSEWGDIIHIKSLAFPMKDVLTTYPIDNDRIYLDGAGEGGEFALHFALSKPQFFAAVAVRSALPRFPQVVPNGGNLPVAIHLRANSPAQPRSAEQAQLLANLEHQVKTLGLPIQIKEHAAGAKAGKGNFAVDVIPEATPEIAAFFSGKKRNLAPKKLTFVTDSQSFAECYWIQLKTFETNQNYAAKLTGVVDTAKNEIAITTENIESFRIYLNDGLVNMDGPIKISVNGQPHTDRVFTRSIDTLVKYFEDNPIDPGFQPTATIDVKVSVAAETQPATDTKPK